MPQNGEGGRDGPTQRVDRIAQILEPALVFFRKLKQTNRWTYEQLYDAYFKRRMSLNNMKRYLAGQRPEGPHPDTVTQFSDAHREGNATLQPQHRLHKETLAALDSNDPSDDEIKLYEGHYDFWRHGRYELVTGRVEVKRHPEALVPYHYHVHTQRVVAEGGIERQFHYEGSVYWTAHNVCLESIGRGEFRRVILRRVPNPGRDPLVGIFLTEEHTPDRSPVAGKILFLHEKWLETNQGMVTPEWVRSQLRNGAADDEDGGQNLLRM